MVVSVVAVREEACVAGAAWGGSGLGLVVVEKGGEYRKVVKAREEEVGEMEEGEVEEEKEVKILMASVSSANKSINQLMNISSTKAGGR